VKGIDCALHIDWELSICRKMANYFLIHPGRSRNLSVTPLNLLSYCLSGLNNHLTKESLADNPQGPLTSEDCSRVHLLKRLSLCACNYFSGFSI
jgi:hypothetical protein